MTAPAAAAALSYALFPSESDFDIQSKVLFLTLIAATRKVNFLNCSCLSMRGRAAGGDLPAFSSFRPFLSHSLTHTFRFFGCLLLLFEGKKSLGKTLLGTVPALNPTSSDVFHSDRPSGDRLVQISGGKTRKIRPENRSYLFTRKFSFFSTSARREQRHTKTIKRDDDVQKCLKTNTNKRAKRLKMQCG